ncbi:MAG: leucine-rich repeat domain-containing protein [Cyanosarcina radialis HA8281-LM2]|jgi:internalin A|nr:leucine-rich repeat domain-containing protein [Cyanosarcina radialis HA8281-LM2]
MTVDRKIEITLALSLGWLLGCTGAGMSQTTKEYKTFAQWCEHLSQLSAAEKYTVEVLLKEAEAKDCQTADLILSRLISLDLSYDRITDLKPISTLTNLTSLEIFYNQIADLQPLSNLTNLRDLYLGANQIKDITPLSNLTNLKTLHLFGNQITDIKPLSSLTTLTILSLDNNPIADRTCPLQPPSLCGF